MNGYHKTILNNVGHFFLPTERLANLSLDLGSQKASSSLGRKKQRNLSTKVFGATFLQKRLHRINQSPYKTIPSGRIDYIDFFRGITMAYMVFVLVFDALAVSNVYRDEPYYVAVINAALLIQPPVLFSFVSGIGVYLFVQKRALLSSRHITISAAKRYGRYILISLPLTAFMWGIDVFIKWEEAIQGIGLSAIFAALAISSTRHRKWHYMFAGLIVLLSILRPLLLEADATNPILQQFPYNNVSLNALTIGTMMLNALYRGWFSVFNMLPLMLGGILFFNALCSGASAKKIILASAVPLVFSIALHASGYQIDYYGKSFAFTFYALGIAGITFGAAYHIFLKAKNFLQPFSVLGAASLEAYVLHNLIIIKPLSVFHLADSLSDITALALSIPLTAMVYILAKRLSAARLLTIRNKII